MGKPGASRAGLSFRSGWLASGRYGERALNGRILQLNSWPMSRAQLWSQRPAGVPSPCRCFTPGALPESFVPRFAQGRRELVFLRWGLIPPRATDPAIGNRMINARAEGLAEKPAFHRVWKERRHLVATDGFYELAKDGKKYIENNYNYPLVSRNVFYQKLL